MATEIQQLRDTAAENDKKVCREGVIAIDLDYGDIRIHDGVTPGGIGGKGLYQRLNEQLQGILKILLPKLMPVGTTIWYDGVTPPEEFVIRDGSLLNIEAYPELYAILGTRYGGDGIKTFGVGDLRGEFIRGLDLGRGVDTGRVIGSAQSDAIRNITGGLAFDGTYGFDAISSAWGAFKQRGHDNYRANTQNVNVDRASTTADFDASAVVPIANENRPRNIALLPCIKY